RDQKSIEERERKEMTNNGEGLLWGITIGALAVYALTYTSTKHRQQIHRRIITEGLHDVREGMSDIIEGIDDLKHGDNEGYQDIHEGLQDISEGIYDIEAGLGYHRRYRIEPRHLRRRNHRMPVHIHPMHSHMISYAGYVGKPMEILSGIV